MTSLAYAALWIFIFSIPWERIFIVPGVSVVARATGAAAAGLAVLAVLMSGRFRRWHGYHFVAMAFVIWTGIVLFVVTHSVKLPSKFWTWPQLFVMVWIIWELAPSVARLRGLFSAYVFGAYLSALDTAVVFRTHGAALKRFSAGGADPNDLAMILALAMPMAWYLSLTVQRPLMRWFYRAYIPVGLLAVGLTGSRGGMVATTVALMIIPFCMTKLTAGRLVSALAMLGLAGGLAVAYVPETLIQRLATTGSELEGGRIGGRGRLWVAGLKAFADRPFVGYGTGSFRTAITPYVTSDVQVAHNSYISVLVEQGMIGLIIFLVMLGALFPSLLKLPRLERRFALVLYASLLTAMLPLTWEDRRAVWFILPALLGFAKAYASGMFGGVPQPVARQQAPPPVRPWAARSPGRVAVQGGGDSRNATA